jgi:hypothetical protein
MARTVQSDDKLPSKLAKYVPAEMVALASGYFAAFGTARLPLVLTVGALLNAAYMIGVARANDPGEPGPTQRLVVFPLLSSIAFIPWALTAIPSVGDAVSLTDDQRAWLLSATTIALPLADALIYSFLPRGDAQPV